MNSVYILKTDFNPMYWIKPETKGQPPSPRYMHTSTYMKSQGFMLVYGG